MQSRALSFIAGGCLILSVGVFINVLFLQKQKAIGSAEPADWQNGAAGNSNFVSGKHNDNGMLMAISRPPKHLVRAVQRELMERKYYGGSVDGNLTIYTRAAIMDYQAEHRQKVTGEVNEPLLRTILLGASLDAAPAVTDIAPQTEDVVRYVQTLLLRAGFQEVSVTGRIDIATTSAIRKFEARSRLPPKSRISYGLMLRLESAAGAKTTREHVAIR